MEKPNISIKDLFLKVKDLRKFFWFLGLHVFLVILLFILFDILFGGILLYKYAFLVKSQKADAVAKNFEFENAAYQDVLKIMEARAQEFKDASREDFPDPFR